MPGRTRSAAGTVEPAAPRRRIASTSAGDASRSRARPRVAPSPGAVARSTRGCFKRLEGKTRPGDRGRAGCVKVDDDPARHARRAFAEGADVLDAPLGHGHRYKLNIVDGWAAVLQPGGWSADDTQRLRDELDGS